MPKHKTEDYKLIAVLYYLENEATYSKTCEIFKCSERSLKRWINRYLLERSIKRHNRLPVSYKVTKKQVKYAIKKLKENEQITMFELAKIVKKKYKDFDITSRQLRNVIRDNNITRKRTRHEHFPIMRYGKPIEKQKELDKFYKEVDKYKLNKIISLDETSIKPSMLKEYLRCKILFSVPYTPKTNPIEMFFNQIKHYLKLNKKVLKFEDLKKSVRTAINKVKKENYKNYFLYAYKKNEFRKVKRGISTLIRKPKIYKS